MKIKYQVLLVACLLMGIDLRINAKEKGADDKKGKAEIVKEFVAINQALAKYESLEIKMTYKYFPTHSESVASEVTSGSYKRKGNKHYNKLMNVESLYTERYTIVADHNSNSLLVADSKKMDVQNISQVDIKSAFNQCSSYQKETISNSNLYKLNFNLPHYEYTSIWVYVDQQTHFLQKMVFYHKEKEIMEYGGKVKKIKPKVEIVYDQINTNPQISDAIFSEEKYIQENNKSVTAAAKYSSYTFYDQQVYNKIN